MLRRLSIIFALVFGLLDCLAWGAMAQVPELAINGAASTQEPNASTVALGQPDWRQSNLNGFGDQLNIQVSALAEFDSQFYAGTRNTSGNGAQLWRSNDGVSWTAVITNGFGHTSNRGIDQLFVFNNLLYAGTVADVVNGGEVWRSDNGVSWTRVISKGFGDPTNGEIIQFAVFSNTLYASTYSYTSTHGLEIWRSATGDAGSWTRVVSNGFNGDTGNTRAVSLAAFNGYLYAGTDNTVTGGEVWRSADGTNWFPVSADGLSDAFNWSITLEPFNGYLYAGTYNYMNSPDPGAELWRCQQCDGSDWQPVPIAKGFGDTENRAIRSLFPFNNALFAVTYNTTTGMEVWRSADGVNWSQVSPDGFGDSNNTSPNYDNAVSVFHSQLFVGTNNSVTGGELWQLLTQLYLPTIMR